MPRAAITVDPPKFAKKGLDRIVREAVAKGLVQGGAALETLVKQKVPVDSGALRKSIGFKVDKKALTLAVGTLKARKKILPYAAIIEFGGTIRPKKSKYLAWPINIPGVRNPIATKKGRAKASPRDSLRNIGEIAPKSFNKNFSGGTFVLPSKTGSGNKVLYAKMGNGKAVPLRVLAKQVKRKGVGYLFPTVRQNRKLVIQAIDRELQTALAAACPMPDPVRTTVMRHAQTQLKAIRNSDPASFDELLGT